MDEIRAVLYPEIRLGWGHSDSEIVEVMDREQERLARSLGDGHRLLRGVAGSGKTITLVCRARHLRALHPDWRILALCFNRVLASHLRQAIGEHERLEVSSFHAWCRRQLMNAGGTIPPPPERGESSDDYWERLPRLLLDAQAAGKAPQPYQAILIDEGQDFADDWYRAILGALAPETNSLFVAVDSSQNIYKRRISWRELGIQAQGRSQVYESTIEIQRRSWPLHTASSSTSTGRPQPTFSRPRSTSPPIGRCETDRHPNCVDIRLSRQAIGSSWSGFGRG
jgi:hypothetical protein